MSSGWSEKADWLARTVEPPPGRNPLANDHKLNAQCDRDDGPSLAQNLPCCARDGHHPLPEGLMPTTPTDIVNHHLNFAGQNVLSYGSWILTATLLVVAFRLGRKEKGTPFYVVMVLAAMVAAFAEPLYDIAFSLYFYSQKGMHHTFTAFGIPQPVWAYSGYAVLYAAPAMYINRRLQQGRLDRRGLIPVA